MQEWELNTPYIQPMSSPHIILFLKKCMYGIVSLLFRWYDIFIFFRRYDSYGNSAMWQLAAIRRYDISPSGHLGWGVCRVRMRFPFVPFFPATDAAGVVSFTCLGNKCRELAQLLEQVFGQKQNPPLEQMIRSPKVLSQQQTKPIFKFNFFLPKTKINSPFASLA